MTHESPERLLEVALDAARAAGDAAMRWFRTGTPAEAKADGSPVTRADREAERALRDVISRAFPGHAILGEEEGATPASGPEPGDASGDVRWILDPVDGTESFVRGVPLWGVLVAAEERGRVVAGVCHLPAAGETVAAALGRGCTWNGAACRVSSVGRLEDAVLVTTSSKAARRRTSAWTALEDRARKVRGWSDCYGYAMVATGRADVAVDPVMAPWDCGPFPVILGEAGGRFTDWGGRVRIDGGDAVATNGRLHDEVLAVLAGRQRSSGDR